MLTILEAIKLSTEFLEKKGIESPRINAEILLSHILKCKRLNLYLTFDQPLKENELKEYRELLRRRGKAEPLQYILGEVEFYGLPIKVNNSVLIPRQETEILVEKVIAFCKEKSINKILDIGTGSGNIAIALAANLPEAIITAVDINRNALETAQLNSESNATSNQIDFLLMDVLNNENQLPRSFEIIVSNPPYISQKEFETLRPELRVYEPPAALTDYQDGLSFFRKISSKAANWLKEGGTIFFELGEGQYADVENIMKENGFKNICMFNDYLNIQRVISGELN